MKISKLFHWLYAILMFLPILVFIPNAFYYGFNEQAVAQEKTEQVPSYYPTNELNNVNDLIGGNVYYYTNSFRNYDATENITYLFIKFLDDSFVDDYNSDYQCYIWTNFYDNKNTYLTYTSSIDNSIKQRNISNRVFYFQLVSTTEYSYIILPKITSYKLFKENLNITTNMSITDSMSYAWHTTWQNDLFSWSYDSFLTQPFLYITNLFNVPATNTLLYCLSYWLNISIIWLCFDVVMYVPLLVHRWLDKGIVE